MNVEENKTDFVCAEQVFAEDMNSENTLKTLTERDYSFVDILAEI